MTSILILKKSSYDKMFVKSPKTSNLSHLWIHLALWDFISKILQTFFNLELVNFMQKLDELFLRYCVANRQTNKQTDRMSNRPKFIVYLC